MSARMIGRRKKVGADRKVKVSTLTVLHGSDVGKRGDAVVLAEDVCDLLAQARLREWVGREAVGPVRGTTGRRGVRQRRRMESE